MFRRMNIFLNQVFTCRNFIRFVDRRRNFLIWSFLWLIILFRKTRFSRTWDEFCWWFHFITKKLTGTIFKRCVAFLNERNALVLFASFEGFFSYLINERICSNQIEIGPELFLIDLNEILFCLTFNNDTRMPKEKRSETMKINVKPCRTIFHRLIEFQPSIQFENWRQLSNRLVFVSFSLKFSRIKQRLSNIVWRRTPFGITLSWKNEEKTSILMSHNDLMWWEERERQRLKSTINIDIDMKKTTLCCRRWSHRFRSAANDKTIQQFFIISKIYRNSFSFFHFQFFCILIKFFFCLCSYRSCARRSLANANQHDDSSIIKIKYFFLSSSSSYWQKGRFSFIDRNER